MAEGDLTKSMLDTDTVSAHLLGYLSYPNAACIFLYFQLFRPMTPIPQPVILCSCRCLCYLYIRIDPALCSKCVCCPTCTPHVHMAFDSRCCDGHSSNDAGKPTGEGGGGGGCCIDESISIDIEYFGLGEASTACEMSWDSVEDVASERRRRFWGNAEVMVKVVVQGPRGADQCSIA